MNFSITQHGNPFHNYKWNEKTRTFSTSESGLVLDFSGVDGVTFKTGNRCTFYTGDCCIFYTGDFCTFDTGWYCAFNAGNGCNFKTGKKCTFMNGWNCTFDTGHNCVAIRYDIPGIIEIPEGKKIKLNDYRIGGYTEVNPTHTIVIDGKEKEISDEMYHTLKEA